MRSYFLRHGESLSNAAPGTLALPEAEGDQLSARGEVQARAAAERIGELGIARIVCSPLGQGPPDGRGGQRADRPRSRDLGLGHTSSASPPITRP